MSTENQKADLSGLRINRPGDSGSPAGKSRSILKTAIVVIVVLFLFLAGYLGMGRVFDSAVEVHLTAASLASSAQANAVLTASGYVVAQRKAAVASKATGRLVYLGVVEGDRVKKDQIIARIEDTDMKAALDQAKANLAVVEADRTDAKRWLDRQKDLLAKGVSMQSDYDAAEARYNRTLASIEAARAGVAGAEVALENTLIRAPFDGTVLTKDADVGEMVVPMAASVGSKAAVVTIADMTSLQVEADVSESNIERVTPNQPCEITLDAYPETRYQGYVAKIVPTADRAKATVMVKVAFKSYDSKVLPEMSAKALFLSSAGTGSQSLSQPMLMVPLSSIVSRNGRKVVFEVSENRAVEVPVATGRAAGALIEVVQGLSAGDRVITNVPDGITNGTRVKVQ